MAANGTNGHDPSSSRRPPIASTPSAFDNSIRTAVRTDLAHDASPPNILPTMSRNPSLAAAIRAIDIDNNNSQNTIKIGTRASALALIQANLVLDGLQSLNIPNLQFKLAPMSVAGDRNKVEPLYLMGGKALWTKDLEVALIENVVDCIVHSFKDVPTTLPDGCEIAAVLQREDPRDALVVKKGRNWKSLEELPEGSCVGSSSVRRVAQLRRRFPHLVFKDCRGNMYVGGQLFILDDGWTVFVDIIAYSDTRLRKLDDEEGPFDALILASAGLLRSQQGARITCYLSSPVMLHATGQGAIGVEIRSGDKRIKDLVSRLNHRDSEWRTSCERSLLRTLEGGCSVPVGVETRFIQQSCPAFKRLELRATIVSLDGQTAVEHIEVRNVKNTKEAEELGHDVAQVLIERGGAKILEELGRIVADKNVKGINDQVATLEKQRHEPASQVQSPPPPQSQEVQL